MTEEIETFASGEEIEAIVTRIEDAVGEDVDMGHLIIAMLSMVVIAQKPSITAPELAMTVKDASKFICMLLGDDGNGIAITDWSEEGMTQN